MNWDVFLDAYQELKNENELLKKKVEEYHGKSIGNSKHGSESGSGREKGVHVIRLSEPTSQSDSGEKSIGGSDGRGTSGAGSKAKPARRKKSEGTDEQGTKGDS